MHVELLHQPRQHKRGFLILINHIRPFAATGTKHVFVRPRAGRKFIGRAKPSKLSIRLNSGEAGREYDVTIAACDRNAFALPVRR